MSKADVYDAGSKSLGGSGKEKVPAKELKEIRTRKGKTGGYIQEHHHTHPEHHPMEEHTSPNQDAMVAHMMQNMGQPNPGEAEADAGQSGIPDASGGTGAPAAPAAGGAAPIPGAAAPGGM